MEQMAWPETCYICKILVRILCPGSSGNFLSWYLLLVLKNKGVRGLGASHDGFLVGIYPVLGEVIEGDRTSLFAR